MNQGLQILKIALFTLFGYWVSLVSIVTVFTENDDVWVFAQRVLNYGQKTFLAFTLCCLVLGLPFLPRVLSAKNFKNQYLQVFLPSLLVAFATSFIFFMKEAFPDFQMSGSSPALWWWIFKESLMGLLVCLPGLILTTGCLSLALKKAPRLSF